MRFRITDGPIHYELRAISIATGTSVKCYSLKSLLFFKASLMLSFNRIMHVHKLQRLLETSAEPNICNYFLYLFIHTTWRLLSTWDLFGRCLACVPCPAPSNHELRLRIQSIWNFLLQADIQNLFYPMLSRTAALIAAGGSYTNYWFFCYFFFSFKTSSYLLLKQHLISLILMIPSWCCFFLQTSVYAALQHVK